jgi:hypothetical protein
MNHIRLIIFFVISSIIGVLGGLCITLLPLFVFMFAAGDAGHIDVNLLYAFILLFVIEFTLAGALTGIMMRTFVGSHIITIGESAKSFAIGSAIGAVLGSAILSIESFSEAAAVGIIVTYVIGGTLCWLKMRDKEKEFSEENLTSLNINIKQ